ncbi:hypothetical protein E2320_013921, partial [Naja naja]
MVRTACKSSLVLERHFVGLLVRESNAASRGCVLRRSETRPPRVGRHRGSSGSLVDV